eukprot:Trichotokara_eunicae@DN6191_c0_g1_i5.p1
MILSARYVFTMKEATYFYPPFEINVQKFSSNLTFRNLFFDQKDFVLTELDYFLNRKDWYAKRGIPDALGFMLYGPPGGGKTAFIKALAHYTGRHVIVFRMSPKTNLTSIEGVMRDEVILDMYGIPHEKRIYVFEDFHLIGDAQIDRSADDDDDYCSEYDSGTSDRTKPLVGQEALEQIKEQAKAIFEKENAENKEEDDNAENENEEVEDQKNKKIKKLRFADERKPLAKNENKKLKSKFSQH